MAQQPPPVQWAAGLRAGRVEPLKIPQGGIDKPMRRRPGVVPSPRVGRRSRVSGGYQQPVEDRLSLEQLWVAVGVEKGVMKIANSDMKFCAGCGEMVLAHWCSPGWVFKTRQHNASRRKETLLTNQKAREIYSDHRTHPGVGEMYKLVTTQSAMLEEVSAELEEMKEKLKTVTTIQQNNKKPVVRSNNTTTTTTTTRHNHHHVSVRENCVSTDIGELKLAPGGVRDDMMMFESKNVSAGEKMSSLRKLIIENNNSGHNEAVHAALCAVETDVVKLERKNRMLEEEKITLEKMYNTSPVIKMSPTPKKQPGTHSEFKSRLDVVKRAASDHAVKTKIQCGFELLSLKAKELDIPNGRLMSQLLEKGEDASILLRELESDTVTEVISKEEWESCFGAFCDIGQSPEEALEWLTGVLSCPKVGCCVKLIFLEGIDFPQIDERTPKLVVSYGNEERTLQYHKPSPHPNFNSAPLYLSDVGPDPELVLSLYLADPCSTAMSDILVGVASLPVPPPAGTATLHLAPASPDFPSPGSVTLTWVVETSHEALFTPVRDHCDPNDLSQIPPPMF